MSAAPSVPDPADDSPGLDEMTAFARRHGLGGLAPEHIAAWGMTVREELHRWWHAETDRALQRLVPTDYGPRAMHDVLERTTWHAAQHTRQVMLMLETYASLPSVR